jgi:hypothetical protein
MLNKFWPLLDVNLGDLTMGETACNFVSDVFSNIPVIITNKYMI